MNDRISVIVPIYNVEYYIEDCVKSILGQSYRNLEIIFVNDGSTDNSIDILKDLISNDHRCNIVSQKNGGLSSARNKGLSVSTGEYVTFIDSDDFLKESYIEELYKNLVTNGADISIAGFTYYYDDCNIYKNTIDMNNDKVVRLSNEEVINRMYAFQNRYNVSFVTAWGKLYRKSLFDNICYPEGKTYEDEFTTYKLYLKTDNIVCINKELYIYRIREGSIMSKKYGLDNLNPIMALEERIDILKDKNINVLETEYTYLCLLSYNMYMLKKHGYVKEVNELKNKYINYYLKVYSRVGLKKKIKLLMIRYINSIIYKCKGDNLR